MLRLLSARAMGWRGRQEEAAKELRGVSVSAILALDPEERAAVWIHAGRREEAVAAARGCSLADLWLTFLRGSSLDPCDWDRVAGLPSRRQARLVFDLFLLDRDRVPESWLRRALATFSRLGSDEPAMRLRSWLRGPWHALETYLRVDSHGTGAPAELFAAAGRSDVLLVWESTERNVVLVAGAGGPEEISCPLREGRLVLRTAHLDERLRALFRVVLERVSIPADPRVESGEIGEGMIGESGAFVGAIRRLRQLAPSRLPILLLGESGTGKELAARAIHSLSPRSDGPFLAYNAAAVSEPLLLADLFGHVRGAFTGADRDREGVFESARCGTVLLDEIGDLPLAAQGALLRVLQEGEIRRVGESRARRVDIRIVAATHRDLEAMVAAGDFRQDLYFRLSVATIRLPPLRERSRDVLLLTDHFLARHSHGSSLSQGARERLLGHDWPGNVRELENVLQVAGTLSSGSGCIRSCHLELPPSRRSPADRSSYHERIDAHRRRILREALEAAQGHRARAAQKLGITRQALSYLVRTLDLA